MNTNSVSYAFCLARGRTPSNALSTASISLCPGYEALSYAWGTGGPKIRIEVNGKPFKITQEDTVEKGRQVSLMGDIFKNCARVYVWLGIPLYEHSGALKDYQLVPQNGPFLLVRHFADDRHLYDLPGFETNGASSIYHFKPGPDFQRLWLPLVAAATASWWHRLWCVQEIILAPRAHIVYGDWQIPWEMLAVSSRNHTRHIAGCCSAAQKALPWQYTMFSDDELVERVGASMLTSCQSEETE